MTEENIQIIVGLGNPGPQYEHTRHNVGAWLVDKLAKSYRVNFKLESKFKGLCAKITINQQDCHLLLPTTFMNNSGQAVIAMANFYKIPLNSILVAHDELDLPTGRVKLKLGGGHGGHNGLRDIIARFGGNQNFKRIRIGIGHPGHSDKVLGYVLGQANRVETDKINEGIDQALAIIPEIMVGNFAKAMQLLHTDS